MARQLRLLGLTALLTLVAAAAVARADGDSESVELPESMKPLLDETAVAESSGSVIGGRPSVAEQQDPRDLPPPEEHEEYKRVRDAMRAATAAATAGGPESGCESPFGKALGNVHGTVAYSNCHDSHISMEDHVYTAVLPGTKHPVTVPIGMKWQCVEFARRYLLDTFGMVFDDVMGAVDIWRFTSLHKHGDTGARGHLGRYSNHDDADRLPEPGAVIIWPIQKDMPFGHVAIVSEVIELTPDESAAAAKAAAAAESSDASEAEAEEEEAEFYAAGKRKRRPRRVARVRIGDQNYRSVRWEHKTYSRELFVETYDNEYYGLVDPDGYRTLGWMAYDSFIKPLDYLVHQDDVPGLPKAATHTENQPQFKDAGSDDDGGAA